MAKKSQDAFISRSEHSPRTKSDTTVDAMVVMENIKKVAQPAMRKISDISITSQAEFDQAGDLLKQLKSYSRDAKEKEQSLTGPLKTVISNIVKLFKPFQMQVEIIENDVKVKMLNFVKQQNDAQAKLLQKFTDGDIKKVSTFTSKQAELEIQNGSAQVRKVWTAVEINAKKTPQEYLTPDLAKIKDALKAGKSVPGWEWKQIESIAV